LLAKVIPKKSININDTSLFAELVKGKHKREKVLKEILLSSDSKEDSKVINVDALDGNDSKPASTNGDLKDIPIPPSSTNGISMENTMPNLDSTGAAPPPPPPETYPYVIKKNKASDLPMPPGIVVPSELKTPSPPKDCLAGPSKKMRLLDMPMPPMIPGAEDLSNDENDSMFGRKSQKGVKGNGTAKTTRPKIIMRRRSDNAVGNWGERCVDVFQIMAQIGEGKLLADAEMLLFDCFG
jgi:cyclin-dependent kinase 12/13